MPSNEEKSRKQAAFQLVNTTEAALRALAALEKGSADQAAYVRANLLEILSIATGGATPGNWPDAAAHFAGAYVEDRPANDVRAARSIA